MEKVNGINYELAPSNQTVSVRQLNNGIKYKGNIVIPSSVSHNGISYRVTSIGDWVFRGCTAFKNSAMTKLHIRSEHPEQIEVAEDAFDGCAEHCTLYVPVGTGYAYRHHPVFGKFREVVLERASSI